MNRARMSWAVQGCFAGYRSAVSLQASYRLRWHGTTQRGRYVMETPDAWGRFA